ERRSSASALRVAGGSAAAPRAASPSTAPTTSNNSRASSRVSGAMTRRCSLRRPVEGAAHRRAAHAEALGDIALDDAGPGGESSPDDEFAELVVGARNAVAARGTRGARGDGGGPGSHRLWHGRPVRG